MAYALTLEEWERRPEEERLRVALVEVREQAQGLGNGSAHELYGRLVAIFRIVDEALGKLVKA